MNFYQLSYFISVAELLSFTRAAERHCIAQTSMSQQIQEIERQLETQLFHRSKRAVKLTPAGGIFLNEARRLVALYEESVRKTQLISSGYEGSLKIGFLGPNERWFLPQMLRNFRRTWPHVKVSLTQGTPRELKEALEDELLDCAFTTSLDIHSVEGFSSQSIYLSPICVVMNRDHPLSGSNRINLGNLAHESFVAISRDKFPGAREKTLGMCAPYGFIPNIVQEVNAMESLVMMIEAEIGIGLLPRFLEAYAAPSICFIELEDCAPYAVESVLVWRTDTENRTIDLLRESLRAVTQ